MYDLKTSNIYEANNFGEILKVPVTNVNEYKTSIVVICMYLVKCYGPLASCFIH